MKVSKMLLYITGMTVIALFYVHQQVELVKMGYIVSDKEKKSLYLLDQREKLVYNLNNLETPVRLEKRLAATGCKFDFPSKKDVIRVVRTHGKKEISQGIAKAPKSSVFDNVTDLFGLRAVAQAREK